MTCNLDTAGIPKLIYVMGIDGTGKSTVSEHLARRLRGMGYEVDVEWLRFNHVLSKPLLGFCRLTGLTRYEVKDGIRVGYHDFHRSRLISWLFVLLQYLDAWRVLHTKVRPKLAGDRKVLILDRYVYDILVDLMIDTEIDDLDKAWLGKRLAALLPAGSVVIHIVRDPQEILLVRPECAVDANFFNRIRLYHNLAERYDFDVITNDGELHALLEKAEKSAGIPR